MDSGRTSRSSETPGGPGPNRVSSSDQSTADLPSAEDFRQDGEWRLSKENRSSSDCSTHRIVGTNSISPLRSEVKDSIEQAPEKRPTFATTATIESDNGKLSESGSAAGPDSWGKKVLRGTMAFFRFVGPGFMIAVAYVDPGNFATDIAAGAMYRFKLLFVVLVSNIFAIILQGLAIKFGTVTGMDLATGFRVFLPRWLNYCLYALAEIAIIAADIAEVVGTAIAFNLLIPKMPLEVGCLLSIVEVMFILLFYRPDGSMRGLRAFEIFLCTMLIGVVVCFCIQLAMIEDTSVGEVFRGYLPSEALVESKGLYLSCGILGATIMPHGLFLGSGMVQPRLREYDIKHGLFPLEFTSPQPPTNEVDKVIYVPSHKAMKHSLKFSLLELVFSLFLVALFINSAITIVAGTSLWHNPDAHELDIFGIHNLLSSSLTPAAGTIFALALLLSALAAGVVCTLAGQMVSEGALQWKIKPWLRRLVTRCISIIPATAIAAAVGREGLSEALTASQVALSLILPFITLPLIYFTSRDKYMTVLPGRARLREPDSEDPSMPPPEGGIKMANSWTTIIIGASIWIIITVMNIANLVLMGIHK